METQGGSLVGDHAWETSFGESDRNDRQNTSHCSNPSSPKTIALFLKRSTKRGRKRFFNQAIHALRERVERTFAWEDKFKRLLLRFEHLQCRHYGMKLMAYMLINVRRFCAA